MSKEKQQLVTYEISERRTDEDSVTAEQEDFTCCVPADASMELKISHTALQDRKMGKGRKDFHFRPPVMTEFSPSRNTKYIQSLTGRDHLNRDKYFVSRATEINLTWNLFHQAKQHISRY